MKNILIIMMPLVLMFSACSKKYPLDLGADYRLDYDGSSYFYILDANSTVIINSHISGFNFDSIFIIAVQKPVDLILQETYNNPEMNLKKRKKLFEESSLRLYWVINKNEHQVYGPFKKGEYLLKRKELGVPQELTLKDE